MSGDIFHEEINNSYNYLPCIKVETNGTTSINEQHNNQDAADLSIESAKVLFLPFAEELGQQTPFSTDINEANVESTAQVPKNFIQGYESICFKDNGIDLGYALFLQSLDTNKFLHACSNCEKVFSNSASLKRHNRTHTGERPYQCKICDKYFSQQSNLWKHVRTHTGERPFECPYCSKKFSQNANMRKHLVLHTGEKPYSCPVCNRSFTQQANLSKHMRLHTGEKPFNCNYCDKKFTQKSNLQKHEYIHRGVKPYPCKVCYKSFTQQNNLRKHELMHNNIKQHICELCSKEYVQKISLFKHQQRCMGGILDPGKLLLDNENELSTILNSVNIKLEMDIFESEG